MSLPPFVCGLREKEVWSYVAEDFGLLVDPHVNLLSCVTKHTFLRPLAPLTCRISHKDETGLGKVTRSVWCTGWYIDVAVMRLMAQQGTLSGMH